MKRLFDIAITLLLMPPVVAVCLLVSLVYLLVQQESPFFFQKRVGQGEREFTIFKLRTMRSNTINVATHEVDRSSVTGIGKFLRATKLDELPQLWNVLKGEMSLVGPRPCLSTQNKLIEERRKYDVFSVLPGITGPSQIRGIDMSDPVKLTTSDSEYIKNAALLYDFKILLATLIGRGSGDRVS